MKIWVTEKPDMAANLAAGLVRAHSVTMVNAKSWRQEGVIHLSNGDVVLPLSGHLLEISPPETYLDRSDQRKSVFSEGVFERLLSAVLTKRPRVPPSVSPESNVRLPDQMAKPRGRRPAEVTIELLGRLISAPQFSSVVNACDTDREGQLIFDELMEYLGLDPEGDKFERLALVSARDVDIAALVKAGLEKNSDPKWVRKRQAAVVRAETDWRLGIILSRAAQVLLGVSNASVGRVQTTVVALVERRRQERERFQQVIYFIPEITLQDGSVARWVARPEKAGQPGYDSEGRIIDEREAARIVAGINRERLHAVEAELRRMKEAPPLPYSSGTLYATVSRRTGLPLGEVEAAAQRLYSKHKAIYYIGSDCQFLPKALLDQSRDTIDALSRLYPGQASMAQHGLVSGAWDDSKVGDHHAIIPTGVLPQGADDVEKEVFKAISMRFLAQFRPDHETKRHRVVVQSDSGDAFVAERTQIVSMGWRDTESDQEISGEVTEVSSAPAQMQDDAHLEADDSGCVEIGGRSVSKS